MNKWRSHFRFNQQERSGIFFLLLLILLFQLIFYLVRYSDHGRPETSFVHDHLLQHQIDSLMAIDETNMSADIHTVNPNYISDYKGYQLGMSLQQIDRLHQYRNGGRFINSLSEFQEVTGVPDSLMDGLSSQLRFPQWQKRNATSPISETQGLINSQSRMFDKKDLNKATEADFRKIRGIGEVLSKRILKFRDALGGFLIDEQLYDVYGLSREVAERVLARYTVMEKPQLVKLNLADADADQLSGIVYLSDKIAHRIVRYRDSVNGFESLEELTKIQEFPKEQIERIKLYLTL